MADGAEIVVYVQSRRAVAAATLVRGIPPLTATLAAPVYVPTRRVEPVYGRRLDAEQREAVAGARRLAAETGNPIRVVDLGRTFPGLRALRRWLLGARVLPVVIMTGSCPWDRLGACGRPWTATAVKG